MFNLLASDLRRSITLEGKTISFPALCERIFSRAWLATTVYRFGRWVADIRFRPLMLLGKIIYYPIFFITQGLTGISIQAYCRAGSGFVIEGTGGTFILAESIGNDFTAGSGVTVGNLRGGKRLPVIGNNVTLEPGAKVLGEITIGNNVLIRGNSLVLTDIPDNTVAMGNPARIKPMQ
jgi:serine acetyltransferase